MILCKVMGNVTATIKHPAFEGRALMIVQPVDEHGNDIGDSFLALDNSQSGPGDTVLVLREGGGIRQILSQPTPNVPVRSLVVGVVDSVDVG